VPSFKNKENQSIDFRLVIMLFIIKKEKTRFSFFVSNLNAPFMGTFTP